MDKIVPMIATIIMMKYDTNNYINKTKNGIQYKNRQRTPQKQSYNMWPGAALPMPNIT